MSSSEQTANGINATGMSPASNWRTRFVNRLQLNALWLLQEYFIFKPHIEGVAPIKEPWEYGLDKQMKTYYTTSDGMDVAMWYQKPADDSKPVYLVFHGNTGHWGDFGETNSPADDRQYRIKLLKEITAQGAGVVAVHLRGYGLSQGYPSEAGFRSNIDAILPWLERDAGIPASRTIVLGESMGAAVAAITAQKMTKLGKPPAVLGLVAGFSSMTERTQDDFPVYSLPEIDSSLRHPFKTAETLQNVSPSTSIYVGHSPTDAKTSYVHSERLFKAAASVPERQGGEKTVHFKSLEGGHTNWDPREIVQDTLRI